MLQHQVGANIPIISLSCAFAAAMAFVRRSLFYKDYVVEAVAIAFTRPFLQCYGSGICRAFFFLKNNDNVVSAGKT